MGANFFTIAIKHASHATATLVPSLALLGLLAWILFQERIKLASMAFIEI
jgi:hypothetical protein